MLDIRPYKIYLLLIVFTSTFNFCLGQDNKSKNLRNEQSIGFTIGTVLPEFWNFNYSYGIRFGKIKKNKLLEFQGNIGSFLGNPYLGPGINLVLGKRESNNSFIMGGNFNLIEYYFPASHLGYRRYFLEKKLFAEAKVTGYWGIYSIFIPDLRLSIGYRFK